MLAPAFPWEFGMRRVPSGWKNKAELLPAEETLPMPWALMLFPVNRASPAGGVCPPHRSGLVGLWARLCGCCCQSEPWVSQRDSDLPDIMEMRGYAGMCSGLAMVPARCARLHPGGRLLLAPLLLPAPRPYPDAAPRAQETDRAPPKRPLPPFPPLGNHSVARPS